MQCLYENLNWNALRAFQAFIVNAITKTCQQSHRHLPVSTRLPRDLFLLLGAILSKELWPFAVLASAYIRNRCFNSGSGKTPFEALTGQRPNIGNMHVFGSTCFAYVQNAKKLDARSKREFLWVMTGKALHT